MATDDRSPTIHWHRTALDPAVLRELHERSDLRGFLQTLGYLGTLGATGALAWYSAYHWPIWLTVLLVFGHGMAFAFQINAIHELGHGTVFRTRWLNDVFCYLHSWLGWINHLIFDASHVRHHRYTLHPPADLEVVLPQKFTVKEFFLRGFINPHGFVTTFWRQVQRAGGRFFGQWEHYLFPETEPAKRRKPVWWSRCMLAGHVLVVAVAIYQQWWMLIVLVTLAPFYGAWLFLLCNLTQHIGLKDNVPDFRLCCRTIYLNPVLRFLYWHMNWHTEHHMYAAVPCYKLAKLHHLIRHELPHCPNGLVESWKQIAEIQARQKIEPGYQFVAQLPTPTRSNAFAVTAPAAS